MSIENGLLVVVSAPIEHHPMHALRSVEDDVASRNVQLLLATEYYGLPVITAIGDPNYVFSDETCAMLTEHGILTKEVVVDSLGNPILYKEANAEKAMPFHSYAWNEPDFKALPHDLLIVLGRELINHPLFYGVTVINSPETPDNSAEDTPQEIASSNTDF